MWFLFLAYLPGHLVGETEQCGGPCFPAKSSEPSYLDRDANWRSPCICCLLTYRNFQDSLVWKVFQIRDSSENLLCVFRTKQGAS